MENSIYGYHLPPDISMHGYQIDRLIHIVHYFMVFLFVGWGIFFVYCLIRFRKREGHKASYESSTSKLPKFAEIGIVAFELFLLIGLSFPVWSRYKGDFPSEKDSLTVRIISQQFVWNIHYPGEDGKFGRSDPKLVTDSNPLGVDATDPNAADDVVIQNQFHFPVSKPVVVHLTSKDVIHSFGVPVLRVKQDTIPGMNVPIHFEAKQTGSFEIVCSQLCGVGHTTMKGNIIVEKQEDFDKWYKEQPRPFKQTKAATVGTAKHEG